MWGTQGLPCMGRGGWEVGVGGYSELGSGHEGKGEWARVRSLPHPCASFLLACRPVETGQAHKEEKIPSGFQAPSSHGGAWQAGRIPAGQLSTSGVPGSQGPQPFPPLGTPTTCSTPGLPRGVRAQECSSRPPLPALQPLSPSQAPFAHRAQHRGTHYIMGRGLALAACGKSAVPRGNWE